MKMGNLTIDGLPVRLNLRLRRSGRERWGEAAFVRKGKYLKNNTSWSYLQGDAQREQCKISSQTVYTVGVSASATRSSVDAASSGTSYSLMTNVSPLGRTAWSALFPWA